MKSVHIILSLLSLYGFVAFLGHVFGNDKVPDFNVRNALIGLTVLLVTVYFISWNLGFLI